jgi:ABC-type multidrug transport system ATPase subunit
MKLTIDHVSKQYRHDFWGLRQFDLEVGPGVIGLLGPNGAGKSTLMRMLATITQPTEGTIKWNGGDIVRSPDTLRAALGYLPQDFGIYPNLSGREFLARLHLAGSRLARSDCVFSSVAVEGREDVSVKVKPQKNEGKRK